MVLQEQTRTVLLKQTRMVQQALRSVPGEVLDKVGGRAGAHRPSVEMLIPAPECIAFCPSAGQYYGCGSPLPMGIDGLSVLDLGR